MQKIALSYLIRVKHTSHSVALLKVGCVGGHAAATYSDNTIGQVVRPIAQVLQQQSHGVESYLTRP